MNLPELLAVFKFLWNFVLNAFVTSHSILNSLFILIFLILNLKSTFFLVAFSRFPPLAAFFCVSYKGAGVEFTDGCCYF